MLNAVSIAGYMAMVGALIGLFLRRALFSSSPLVNGDLVLVYAGGKTRFGVLGSALGVHRFVTTRPVDDPVAEAQRISGAVLGYMTKMGVSSSIVEAMSETREIRWLSPKQALAMNLVIATYFRSGNVGE